MPKCPELLDGYTMTGIYKNGRSEP